MFTLFSLNFPQIFIFFTCGWWWCFFRLGGGGGSLSADVDPLDDLEAAPRDPNKFDKMFTDCGAADFLKGNERPLPLPLFSTGLGCTRGGGGRGGGAFLGASNGESSQFVVGVYLCGFPAGGGGAGAGLEGPEAVDDGTDDHDDEFICKDGRKQNQSPIIVCAP